MSSTKKFGYKKRNFPGLDQGKGIHKPFFNAAAKVAA